MDKTPSLRALLRKYELARTIDDPAADRFLAALDAADRAVGQMEILNRMMQDGMGLMVYIALLADKANGNVVEVGFGLNHVVEAPTLSSALEKAAGMLGPDHA